MAVFREMKEFFAPAQKMCIRDQTETGHRAAEAESIVKQHEWELAEWKQQVEGKPADEKKPPERKSVVEKFYAH